MIWYIAYVKYYTCIHNIPVESVWHSFEKVAFKTHCSPCDRVWHCLSSRTKGNPFIHIYTYIYTLIEGNVSVRKCSMTPWNCLLNKQTIPCRKWNIYLKGYSSISSCTLRDHGSPFGQWVRHAFMQVLLKKMQPG